MAIVSSVRECGCRDVVEGTQTLVVGTCSQCLPVGSIHWLIENGCQLELFGEEGVAIGHERGLPQMRVVK